MHNLKFKQLVVKAIDKLQQQGVLSKSNSGGCWYSGVVDGKSVCCIVGHMMPNKEVRKAADNSSGASSAIEDLWGKDFEWTKQFTQEQMFVLNDLQKLHDNVDNCLTFDEIIIKMENIAGELP